MASKDSNGLVISLSIFVLLTVGLGVAWYMTWAHSTDLQTQLTASKKAEGESKGFIIDKDTQLDVLKQVIGHGNPKSPTDEVVTGVRTEIAALAGDGSASALSLEPALIKNTTDRDINIAAATERGILAQTIAEEKKAAEDRHVTTMNSMQTQVSAKEEELRNMEALHGEQLRARDKQIDELKITVREEQDKFTTLQTQSSREIEELKNDIIEKRIALTELRKKARELEDQSFEREDGRLVFVDQSSLTGSIDLGSRDELRVGTTFSVYKKNNSGVGRRSNEDIKGKIEVIKITGDHNAVVRIVDQLPGDPLAKEDPIYSPIFASGQKLEIAVAGLVDSDGSPLADRDEFIRLVNGANAKIVIQISDDAKLVDQDLNELTEADPIATLITEKTRFLIIGDLGTSNQTQDSVKQALYQKMQLNASKMDNAALNHGVYVISLSNFLEWIGYSRKNIAFKPGDKYPGFLTNGGLSSTVSPKPQPQPSPATVSGIFSKPGRKPQASNGAVSGLYANPSDDE